MVGAGRSLRATPKGRGLGGGADVAADIDIERAASAPRAQGHVRARRHRSTGSDGTATVGRDPGANGKIREIAHESTGRTDGEAGTL